MIDVKSRRAYPLLTKQLKQRRKKKESKDKVKRGRGRPKGSKNKNSSKIRLTGLFRVVNWYLKTVKKAVILNNMAIAYSKLNKLKEVKKAHRRSLKIREELAKTNQFAYNSDLAMSLNNLANLYNKLNQIEEAKKKYIEALNIYKKLAKNNPSTYNSNVAMTLYNLTLLYNQIKKSKETYGIELAKTLVMGVALFHQPIENLDEAEEILKKFRGVPKAERLLKIIYNIKKR
uniref:TPR domain protein n=1 Tax=Alvinella pompejana epibiont 7G3 TaxID=244800 RepID=Q6W3L8_9BACT|nr:TPR domain protein [Alvinella pompejana epibiont 7G3]